ncbi:MAG TPA: phage major capsid protein, partial [Candidatus Rokubacteria bacterium]|nr:phage major capsid protein [Candidatus Rokubacteria bacterium]
MIGMSAADLGKFQINRFLLSLADKNPSLAPFERECSDAAAVKMGRTPQGAFLPPDIVAGYAMARAQRLAQTGRRDIASSGTGAYLIGTDHLDGEFIEMLRPVSALANLGARVLDGLVGNIEIPRRETGATFYVINNETTGVTESTPTFGRVQGSPKTVAA